LTLQEFHNTPITASNLCGKLATRLKYFWPPEEGSEKRVTPQDFTLSDYVDTERIVIAKFQNIWILNQDLKPQSRTPQVQQQLQQRKMMKEPEEDHRCL
jgi:hypothetical protein